MKLFGMSDILLNLAYEIIEELICPWKVVLSVEPVKSNLKKNVRLELRLPPVDLRVVGDFKHDYNFSSEYTVQRDCSSP